MGSRDWLAVRLLGGARAGPERTVSQIAEVGIVARARLAELVDASDLKSELPKGRCRFESGSGHQSHPQIQAVSIGVNPY